MRNAFVGSSTTTWNDVTLYSAENISVALSSLLEAVSASHRLHEGEPRPGSAAANELADAGDRSLKTIQGQGAMLIELAGDHISAAAKSLTIPVETVAPWTCVRAVLETSALAAWLYDPEIAWQARIQRSIALRFEGVDQQIKFAKSVGAPAESIEPMIRRLSEIAAQGEAIGFPAIKDKRNRLIGAGMKMPTATDLVESVLGQGPTYRATSAVVHGHFWAVNQLCFQESASATEAAKASGFAAALEKTLTPVSALYLYVAATRAFGCALWNQARFYGWDFRPMIRLIETTFDRFGVAPAHYFWRLQPGA